MIDNSKALNSMIKNPGLVYKATVNGDKAEFYINTLGELMCSVGNRTSVWPYMDLLTLNASVCEKETAKRLSMEPTLDGYCKDPVLEDIVVGTVLRGVRTHEEVCNSVPFSDSVVVAVKHTKDGVVVKLVRPFVQATDCNPLLGNDCGTVGSPLR